MEHVVMCLVCHFVYQSASLLPCLLSQLLPFNRDDGFFA